MSSSDFLELPARICSIRNPTLVLIPRSMPLSYSYMSTFFDDQNRKPIASIPKTEKTADEVRASVKQLLIEGKAESPVIIRYLYDQLRLLKETCEKEWISYGTQIAGPLESISPLNILQCLENGVALDLPKGRTANADDDKWMLVYIVAVYQASRIRVDSNSYRNKVLSPIDNHFTPPSGLNISLKSIPNSYKKWIYDPTFCKLIAALDMFLFKFPGSDWAHLRAATSVSRYKDCAGLLAWQHILRILGIDHDNFSEWLWDRKLKDDFDRMFKQSEEYGIENSYFPYQSDLGLVKITAYSASENCGIHFFCHAIGAMFGDDRSKNSHYLLKDRVSSIIFSNIITNVKIASYVLDNNKAEIGVAEDGEEPSSRDPQLWLTYMKRRQYEPTERMKQVLKAQVARISNPREGTIGRMIKEKFDI